MGLSWIILFVTVACDGLSVVEAALGLDRAELCKPPDVAVPHPGPCKGWKAKRQLPSLAPAPGSMGPKPRTAAKKATAKPRAKGAKPRVKPLTDRQFAEHQAQVQQKLKASPAWGYRHTADMLPDATARDIVEDVYRRYAKVPKQGKAIFSAGMSGAGKTTALRQLANVDDYVMVSADDFKEELARRDLIPKAADLSPMERATLSHSESVRLSEMLADRAMRDRKNLIWDTTMSDEHTAQWRIRELRDSGYGDISALLVNVPAATAAQRVSERYREGLEAWRNGEGLGGRFIPPDVVARLNPQQNQRAFDRVKPLLADWTVFDNTGTTPKITSRKRGNADG